MLIKPKPIDIGEDSFDGFDLLDRASAAHQLTELVDRIEAPMVIALDGDWGTGKSWFLKLWPGEHKKQGGLSDIIYFDAFAHDFLDDPLASLALRLEAEMKKRHSRKTRAVRAVTTAVKKIVLPVARVTAAVATAGASEAVTSGTKAVISEIESLRDRLWTAEKLKLKAMEDFRSAIANLSKEKTLVFIVDELDRCRPDYSLSLLEVMKHFFDVPRVHFVLGANLNALCSSIAARYGGGIEPDRYLQKFVNLTMTLPDPRNTSSPTFYISSLIERIKSNDRRNSNKRDLLIEIREISEFPRVSSTLTLRGVERIFDRVFLIPDNIDRYSEAQLSMVALAAVLESIDRDQFYKYVYGLEYNEETKRLITEIDLNSPPRLAHKSEFIGGLYNEMIGRDAGEEIKSYVQAQHRVSGNRDFRSIMKFTFKETFGTFRVLDPVESLVMKD